VQKDQNHPVSSGESDQFTARFRLPKLTGIADNLIQLLQHLALLIDEKFRITDDVYEQDMCYLEMKIELRFGHKGPAGSVNRRTFNAQRGSWHGLPAHELLALWIIRDAGNTLAGEK
jgi:hypothetical protein